MRWLACRAMGISENRLAQELRASQLQRMHHEMLVLIMLEALDTGKTHTIKALLDNRCTAMCINQDYAKAEAFNLKELNVPILARNADRDRKHKRENHPLRGDDHGHQTTQGAPALLGDWAQESPCLYRIRLVI